MTREQMEAAGRLQVWIRDFGHDKSRDFIVDLRIVLAALAPEASPPPAPTAEASEPAGGSEGKLAKTVDDLLVRLHLCSARHVERRVATETIQHRRRDRRTPCQGGRARSHPERRRGSTPEHADALPHKVAQERLQNTEAATAKLRGEIDRLKQERNELAKPIARGLCYESVLEECGIENNVIGYVRGLRAEIERLKAELANAATTRKELEARIHRQRTELSTIQDQYETALKDCGHRDSQYMQPFWNWVNESPIAKTICGKAKEEGKTAVDVFREWVKAEQRDKICEATHELYCEFDEAAAKLMDNPGKSTGCRVASEWIWQFLLDVAPKWKAELAELKAKGETR